MRKEEALVAARDEVVVVKGILERDVLMSLMRAMKRVEIRMHELRGDHVNMKVKVTMRVVNDERLEQGQGPSQIDDVTSCG